MSELPPHQDRRSSMSAKDASHQVPPPTPKHPLLTKPPFTKSPPHHPLMHYFCRIQSAIWTTCQFPRCPIYHRVLSSKSSATRISYHLVPKSNNSTMEHCGC